MIAQEPQAALAVLSIEDEQFYNLESSRLTEVEFELSDLDYRGLLLWGPRKVDTKERDDLPVILGCQATGARLADVPPEPNCFLVCMDTATDSVSVSAPLVDPKEETTRGKPREAERADKGDPNVVATKLYPIQARGQLGIPWTAGRVSLVAFAFDWVSNPIDVDVLGESTAPSPVKRICPDPRYPDGDPGAGGASYRDSAPPGTGGLQFGVTTHVASQALARQVRVSGKFAAKASRSRLACADLKHLSPADPGRWLGAGVPATLLVVSLKTKRPLRFDWVWPVYTRTALTLDSLLAGAFEIDLSRTGAKDWPAGEYVAYMAFEGRLHGPVRFSL